MGNFLKSTNVPTGPLGERMIAFMRRYYPNVNELYVTSAYRKNDTGSHHGGRNHKGSPTAAVDFGAYDDSEPNSKDQRDMGLAADWLFKHFSDLTVELIHTQPHNDHYTYVKNQKRVGAYATARHVNHIHWATSHALMDKIEARAKKKFGVKSEPQPGPGSVYNTGNSITYGWDASDYDHDRGMRAKHIRQAAKDGISFFTHKLTEKAGNGQWIHNRAGNKLKAARDAGIPFLGVYIVPRSGASVKSQVDFALAELNKQAPWWKDFPGWFFQVDLEHWPYDKVPPSVGAEMARQLEARTGRQVIMYAPRWAYGNSIPAPWNRVLWNSHYVSGSGNFKSLYPGSGSNGWNKMSNRTPVILQYSSKAVTGGMHTTDANAFRGSEADFAKMIDAQGRKEMHMIGAKKGDQGEHIETLQVMLFKLGHYDKGGEGGPNFHGKYDDRTAAGVLAMRKAIGSTAKSGDHVSAHAYEQLMRQYITKYSEGVEGPKGEPGKDGVDGKDGQDGKDGATPTEIVLKGLVLETEPAPEPES